MRSVSLWAFAIHLVALIAPALSQSPPGYWVHGCRDRSCNDCDSSFWLIEMNTPRHSVCMTANGRYRAAKIRTYPGSENSFQGSRGFTAMLGSNDQCTARDWTQCSIRYLHPGPVGHSLCLPFSLGSHTPHRMHISQAGGYCPPFKRGLGDAEDLPMSSIHERRLEGREALDDGPDEFSQEFDEEEAI